MKNFLKKYWPLLIIFLITIITYLPTWQNGFVYWDDSFQITRNADIQTWSSQSVKNILTTPCIGMYQPVTSLVYFFTNNLIGKSPAVFHGLSLLLHLINIVLVWLLAKEFFKDSKLGLAVAGLFAIQPMNVEVVAWASAVGTLLSSGFSLAAILFYGKYQAKGGRKNYYLVILLSLLAMFTKSSAVILPVIFVALDYARNKELKISDILKKWPLWLAGLVAGIATIIAREIGGHFSVTTVNYSMFDKLIMWLYSYAFYFFKIIIPLNLSPFYPYPQKLNGFLPLTVYLGALVSIIFIVILIKAKRLAKVTALAGWFFINLVLVVRIKPVGKLITADRYDYLAGVAVLALLVLGLDKLSQKNELAKKFSLGLLIITGLCFSIITFNQTKAWQNDITITTTAIDLYGDNPETAYLYDNRGNARAKIGETKEAIIDLQTAINYKPGLPNQYNNLGIIVADDLNKPQKALDLFNKAIELNDKIPLFHYNRATTHEQLGDHKKACADFLVAKNLGYPVSAEILNKCSHN